MRLMVMLCVVMVSIGVLGVSAQNDDPTFEYSVIDDQFRHAQMIQTVDIDDDGDEDVILASSLNDTIYLYLNDGSGESWERVNVAPENSIVAMQTTVADFDSDGDLDIASVGLFDRVACVFCSAGVVHWYENMGDNTEWTTHVIDGELWGAFFIDTYDYLDEFVTCVAEEEQPIEQQVVSATTTTTTLQTQPDSGKDPNARLYIFLVVIIIIFVLYLMFERGPNKGFFKKI